MLMRNEENFSRVERELLGLMILFRAKMEILITFTYENNYSRLPKNYSCF